MDGQEDGAANLRQEFLEFTFEASLEGRMAESRQNGSAPDDFHLFRHEELAHRAVSSHGILELHPEDLDAKRGEDASVLFVGPQHELWIEALTISQQEEVGILLKVGMPLPCRVRTD